MDAQFKHPILRCQSIFVILIYHSAVLFFLAVNIILSELLRFFETVFQQFKIHCSRKNIYLKLFGLICKNFNSKTLATDIISVLILPKQIAVVVLSILLDTFYSNKNYAARKI